ncbi:hypothetical protein MNBD_ALPHA12-2204 [hydrothermal vent metagenome]|uniref:Uncharacterized protein n=1 Tax=hydrothermal vent metagenome TaxID=652676 RepID=A0A3B0TUT3_9ZZZZ
MASSIKTRIAVTAFLLGNAARLSVLAALVLVPVSLELGGNGLVLKSSAAYASDNGKMSDGVANSASDGFGAGSGSGGNSGSDMPDKPLSNSGNGSQDSPIGNPGGDMPDMADSNPGGDMADVPDSSPNNNSQSPNSDDDSGGGSSAGDENSQEIENHRGAIRPANLSEFLSSLRNGSRIVKAQREGENIEIEYSDGWQERIEDGEYILEGPNNDIIIRRPVTKRDYQRLNSAF